jgi:hypothetical protein
MWILLNPLKLKGMIALAVVFACGLAGLLGSSPIWIAGGAILLSCDAWPRLREARLLALSIDEHASCPRDVEQSASMHVWVMQANIVMNSVYAGAGWLMGTAARIYVGM